MPSTGTPDPPSEAVATVLSDALELSHRVHASPEIAFEEQQAAAWTAELLERHAFDVTAPLGGLETAIHPMMAIAPQGTPGSQSGIRRIRGWRGRGRDDAVAIRVMAASAIELVQRPELVERAWADLDAQGDAESRRRRRPG